MKTQGLIQIYTLLLLSVMIVTSCKKKDSQTETPLFIGQSYQGGIVAYILQTGDPGFKSGEMHGIIAAPADLDSFLEWGCEGSLIIGANDTTLGGGNQNTINIISGCNKTNIAARLCADMDIHGFSDWYLPNKQELEKLYINRLKIGGFHQYHIYWSSSQYNAKYAWRLSFLPGIQYTFDKSTTGYIRPVRSF